MASCNRYLLATGCIGVLISFFLVVLYTTHEYEYPQRGIIMSTVLQAKDYFVENGEQQTRLTHYCNVEVPNRVESEMYGISGWELQHLAVNIRHGDRSTLHRIPGTDVTTPPIGDENSSYLDVRAKQYLPSFKVLMLTRVSAPGLVETAKVCPLPPYSSHMNKSLYPTNICIL